MASIQVRQAASGARYDVHYRLDGAQRKKTFQRRKDADSFKRKVESDELAGLLVDPRGGETIFGQYVEQWLATRVVRGRPLTSATRQGYRGLLRRHLLPELSSSPLRKITPERVRHWYSATAQRAGVDQAAKAYRVLRAVLNTAAEDRLISRNPCTIRGGGIERAPERPSVETSMVLDLADAIAPRLRAFVLLAGFGTLRSGELLGLERQDVDPLRCAIHVRRSAQEIAHVRDEGGNIVESHGREVSDPKSEAGKRIVGLPRSVMDELEKHLATYVGPESDALVFTREPPKTAAPGSVGRYLRRQDLSKAWRAACIEVGVAPWDRDHPSGIRPHDLRHHAATTTARIPGVTTREIMARLGHASPRAALIYQHAAEDRDRRIADHLDAVIASTARHKSASVVGLPGAR